ncbi:hypothetical protein HPB48_025320 [Haemaphysalis longicornis]|uniref:Endonuclease/exonuclease/phosphatase domain-containing protein n=1 Tax=Haemaphysalis longicornis TaxID=44386 RepID=A0A9J6H7I8_HAELO|nr:hypothetical protein HPB48_025320 [Haemaphysalis longicornis]
MRSVLPKCDSSHALIDTIECDLVALTKTWLNTAISDFEIESTFPNFDIFRCDRSGKRGDGVLIAAHSSLQCSVINVPSPLELIFVRCNSSYPPVVTGVCYPPPDSDHSFIIHLHEALRSLISSRRQASNLLFGDFNLPAIN